MKSVSLRGANLHDARVAGVDMSKADLTGADLSKSRLLGVDVADADFTGGQGRPMPE